MSRVGVTAGDVQDTVAAAIGGREAGVIFEGDRRFPVVIRLPEAARSDLTAVAQVPVPTPEGGFVPLSTVADIGIVDGPNQISRENGKRRVVVQANVRGRDVAGVVADAQQAIATAETDLANAEANARAANGPALAAAQEAARIARIGYREGKFGQLDLLEAERTLAQTRSAAIDALAAYHDAKARLERLTARAPANTEALP